MSTQVHTVRAILLSIFVLGFLFAAVPPACAAIGCFALARLQSQPAFALEASP